MEVRRTVPVKLDMTEEAAALLHETIDDPRDVLVEGVGRRAFAGYEGVSVPVTVDSSEW